VDSSRTPFEHGDRFTRILKEIAKERPASKENGVAELISARQPRSAPVDPHKSYRRQAVFICDGVFKKLTNRQALLADFVP
jgi:hypothetical protein